MDDSSVNVFRTVVAEYLAGGLSDMEVSTQLLLRAASLDVRELRRELEALPPKLLELVLQEARRSLEAIQKNCSWLYSGYSGSPAETRQFEANLDASLRIGLNKLKQAFPSLSGGPPRLG